MQNLIKFFVVWLINSISATLGFYFCDTNQPFYAILTTIINILLCFIILCYQGRICKINGRN